MPIHAGASARDLVTCVQAKGAGYAMSRTQELELVQRVAHTTGMTTTVHFGTWLKSYLIMVSTSS